MDHVVKLQNEYRIRSTGQTLSETELRESMGNTSLPAILDARTLNEIGVDLLFEAPLVPSQPPGPPSRSPVALQFAAVRLSMLDKDRNPIRNAVASGFLRRENEEVFLYTCWHVVTGYDLLQPRISSPPDRRFIQIEAWSERKINESLTALGGTHTAILPLYASDGRPAWQQESQHVPNLFLNQIGIKVPRYLDVVRVRVPPSVSLPDFHIHAQKDLTTRSAVPGRKMLLVGFPYGYSLIEDSPTPLVLSRFVAGIDFQAGGRFLLDGYGAPGMSGGPVFMEYEGEIHMLGIYAGLIWPEVGRSNAREKTTALGVAYALGDTWAGYMHQFSDAWIAPEEL